MFVSKKLSTVFAQSATVTFHHVHQFWSRGLERTDSQKQEAAQEKPFFMETFFMEGGLVEAGHGAVWACAGHMFSRLAYW